MQKHMLKCQQMKPKTDVELYWTKHVTFVHDVLLFISANVNRCHSGWLYNSITCIPDKPCLLFPQIPHIIHNFNLKSAKISAMLFVTKIFVAFGKNILTYCPLFLHVCKYDILKKQKFSICSQDMCWRFDKYIVQWGKNDYF